MDNLNNNLNLNFFHQELKSTETTDSFEVAGDTSLRISESLEAKKVSETVSKATNVIGVNIELAQTEVLSTDAQDLLQTATKKKETTKPDKVAVKHSNLTGV